jgi:serine/threonine-protein kinase
MSVTREGVIVGTLQYMAPEQIEGKPADARTDLWALGAITYEMVTGKRPFEATSAASLIGAILEREPAPLATQQSLTPPGLDRLVRHCLAKAPDDRPDTAHDLANDLRWLRESSVAAFTGVVSRRGRMLRAVALISMGALTGAALTSWRWGRWRPVVPRPQVIRSELSVRPAQDLSSGGVASAWMPTPGGSRTALTWTPDGGALVFVGRSGTVQQLYVRSLDAAEARPLAGTERAQVPAVSADGHWVAFWAPTSLKKVPLRGGPVMELAAGINAPPTGLAWDGGDRLFFSKIDGGLWQIPPGGVPESLTTVSDTEQAHILSSILPGSTDILYTARKRVVTWGDEEVVALELATRRRTVLLHDAADARYVPTGHLVFLRRGVLFAIPFDRSSLKIVGSAVPLIEGVGQALVEGNTDNITGAGQFAIAKSGALAWIPGAVPQGRDVVLVTVDRQGRVSALGAPVRPYGSAVRVSPDGRQLAVTVGTLTENGLWLYDFGRGVLTSLLRVGEAGWPLVARWTTRLFLVAKSGPDFSWIADRRWECTTRDSCDGALHSVLVDSGRTSARRR